jgi:hypothetical protein
MLTSGYHAVKIRIFDMGLVYKYGQRKRPPKSLSGDSMTSASFKVVLNLTKCLIGAKELFDVFMVIPEGEHDKLPLSIWYQLILAIMVLYRLSVGLPETSDWDREIAHDAVNLPESLDKLIDRLRSAESKRRAESQPSNDKCLFTIFPDMVESVKESLISASKYPTQNNACEVSAHPSFVSSNSAPSTQRHRCPAMRNLRRQAAESTMEDARLQRCIAEEIQNIENERLLTDFLVTDICSI